MRSPRRDQDQARGDKGRDLPSPEKLGTTAFAARQSSINRIECPRANADGGGGDQRGGVKRAVSEKGERQNRAEDRNGRGPGPDRGGVGETGVMRLAAFVQG